MPVPAEIRAVPRPVNTIVEDRGTDGLYRYAVRSRARSSMSTGGNPSPRNGNVIGHIIDFQFIPKMEKTAVQGPTFLSYGSSALIHEVSGDLFSDLLKVYPAGDAYTIMSIAALRVAFPHVTNSRLSSRYQNCFISQYYHDASLSKNSVSGLLVRLGQDAEKRKQFFWLRLESIKEDHHIAVDGMLKQDNSSVNSLSSFSFKGRVKGTKDISMIYAYDIDEMEPICAEVFPGRKTDAMNFASFIERTGLQKGVIVADKGFPISKIEGYLSKNEQLHFVSPLKRDDKRISNNDMYEYEGSLLGVGKEVQYKKAKLKTGNYLYSFRDQYRAAREEADWLKREKNPADGSYNISEYNKMKNRFGTIVFISDLDMPPLKAYLCYEERWLILCEQYGYPNIEEKSSLSIGDFRRFW